jgi:UDP-3-O-[3-hydroxymyristoyl] N-acetylglucosamine deacetylase
MPQQHTLKSPVALSGVGLHTGNPVHVRILPSPPNTGLRFVRTDLRPAVEVPAASRHVADTQLATVLRANGADVSTVEHCVATLAGLEIDNAVVEVDGPELPILDGSALPYVESIAAVGLKSQPAPRKALRVEKPLRVQDGEKFCILRPSSGFSVTYTIDFSGRLPGTQHFYLEITPNTFATELSPARTFGFLEEVEYLRSTGKARGGSLENAVVLHEGRVLNPEGLRIPNEFVRHKILDAIGDLALIGTPVLGHLIVHKGGHALHDRLVKALLGRPDAWAIVDLEARAHGRRSAAMPCREIVPAHA